jgi:SAM-dependent methyltransferase
MTHSDVQAIRATTARYSQARATDRYYVALKLRTDPLTRLLVHENIHLGDVVDVGCGRGQFGLLLHELGRVRSLFGYDWDHGKVALAGMAAGDAGRFEVADLRAPPNPSVDTALVFDVLHYLTVDEQQNLLRALVSSLRPGGRILLRTLHHGQGWQTGLSRATEHLGKAFRVNRSHTLTFRPSCQLRATLEALGLTVRSAKRGSSPLLDNCLWVAEMTGRR